MPAAPRRAKRAKRRRTVRTGRLSSVAISAGQAWPCQRRKKLLADGDGESARHGRLHTGGGGPEPTAGPERQGQRRDVARWSAFTESIGQTRCPHSRPNSVSGLAVKLDVR